MSGGHFDYQESRLDYIADQIEDDIKYNDIPYDSKLSVEDSEKYGYQFEPKTIQFLHATVEKLKHLKTILHEYDLAVSGDSSEKYFQERVGIQ